MNKIGWKSPALSYISIDYLGQDIKCKYITILNGVAFSWKHILWGFTDRLEKIQKPGAKKMEASNKCND